MDETSPEIAFLFLGNQPILDFINTRLVLEGMPVDLMGTFSDLLAWFVKAGLMSAEDGTRVKRQWEGTTEAKQVLDQAKAFRDQVREVVERIVAGQPVSLADIEVINKKLRYHQGYSQLILRGEKLSRTFQTESNDPGYLLGLLADATANLLSSGDFQRIKKCQNPACVLLFLDTTKNHARVWCNMATCGNQSKVAAHYRRHRTRSN